MFTISQRYAELCPSVLLLQPQALVRIGTRYRHRGLLVFGGKNIARVKPSYPSQPDVNNRAIEPYF